MRRHRGHLPARLRRTRHRRGIEAKHEQRHARSFGGKGKAAAGRQVQFPHRPPTFNDHRPQRSAAQGINRGSQQCHRIGYKAQQAIARRASQIAPAAGLHKPALGGGTVRTQPHHAALALRHPRGHRHGQTCGGRGIARFGRIDFVDAPISHAACQRGIKRCDAGCPAARFGRGVARGWQGGGDSHSFLLCSNPSQDQAAF